MSADKNRASDAGRRPRPGRKKKTEKRASN